MAVMILFTMHARFRAAPLNACLVEFNETAAVPPLASVLAFLPTRGTEARDDDDFIAGIAKLS